LVGVISAPVSRPLRSGFWCVCLTWWLLGFLCGAVSLCGALLTDVFPRVFIELGFCFCAGLSCWFGQGSGDARVFVGVPENVWLVEWGAWFG